MKQHDEKKSNKLNEPLVDYIQQKITTTSFDDDSILKHTARLTPEERMAYLQKLRGITIDEPLRNNIENGLKNGSININPTDESI